VARSGVVGNAERPWVRVQPCAAACVRACLVCRACVASVVAVFAAARAVGVYHVGCVASRAWRRRREKEAAR
jgi:hypothetical protein